MSKLKPVELLEDTGMPRWLLLQEAIDMRLYILEKMVGKLKGRSAIDKMVDNATGYEKQLTTEGLELMAELRWLKKEFDKETKS